MHQDSELLNKLLNTVKYDDITWSYSKDDRQEKYRTVISVTKKKRISITVSKLNLHNRDMVCNFFIEILFNSNQVMNYYYQNFPITMKIFLYIKYNYMKDNNLMDNYIDIVKRFTGDGSVNWEITHDKEFVTYLYKKGKRFHEDFYLTVTPDRLYFVFGREVVCFYDTNSELYDFIDNYITNPEKSKVPEVKKGYALCINSSGIAGLKSGETYKITGDNLNTIDILIDGKKGVFMKSRFIIGK